MVEQFNLRTTKSASQLVSSVEISSPMMVRHTAGQHPSPLLSGVVISGPPDDQPPAPGDHSSANHEGPSVPPVFVDTSSPDTERRASGLGGRVEKSLSCISEFLFLPIYLTVLTSFRETAEAFGYFVI